MKFRSDYTSADMRDEFRSKAAQISKMFADENIRDIGIAYARWGEQAARASDVEKRIRALMFSEYATWDEATHTNYKPTITVGEDKCGNVRIVMHTHGGQQSAMVEVVNHRGRPVQIYEDGRWTAITPVLSLA
jgi:hypothetical protein